MNTALSYSVSPPDAAMGRPWENLRLASVIVENTAFEIAGETDATVISQLIIMAAELDRLNSKLQLLSEN